MQICSGLAQLAKAGMFLVFGILVFGCSADQCCSGQCISYLGILVHIWVDKPIFGCSSVQCRFADDEVSGARSSQGSRSKCFRASTLNLHRLSRPFHSSDTGVADVRSDGQTTTSFLPHQH